MTCYPRSMDISWSMLDLVQKSLETVTISGASNGSSHGNEQWMVHAVSNRSVLPSC